MHIDRKEVSMDFIKELAITNENLDKYRAQQPKGAAGFTKMHQAAMTSGALSVKEKELIALGIGIARQCSDCIGFHVRAAMKAGATKEEIAETVSVSILMGGGPSFMYGARALDAFDQFEAAKT